MRSFGKKCNKRLSIQLNNVFNRQSKYINTENQGNILRLQYYQRIIKCDS